MVRFLMTSRSDSILRKALELPTRDRADVAAELLSSLEPSSTESSEAARAAWAIEIERRAKRVVDGEAPGESWDEVRERTARKITEQ